MPRVAIAAPHHVAVDAAAEVVSLGGNPVDAALAAAASLTVVYPNQCSLGGDLFAVLRRPDGTTVSVNASGAYGTRSVGPTPATPAERSQLAARRPTLVGPLSVSVPGVVSGWAMLLPEATLPVGVLLGPAIRQAYEGVPVSPGLAAAISDLPAPDRLDPGLRSLVTNGSGAFHRRDDQLRQERLGDTLTALTADGLDSFYRGGVADRLRRSFEDLGVPVGVDDLRGHSAVREEPLSAAVPGLRIMTTRPNSQGYLLPVLMMAIDALGGHHRVGGRVLLELFRQAGARRDAELADPRFMTVGTDELLSPSLLRRDLDIVSARLTRAAPPASVARPGPAQPSGDTVAVTAVGDDGTVVSLIQSVFHPFGSGIVDPWTGIVLHNRAAGFSGDPDSPNALAPAKRPAHTLMPVIIEYADGRISAHGSMGGKAQPQIHTQLLRAVSAGMDAAQAVAAPRFAVKVSEVELVVAEVNLDPATMDELATAGLEVVTVPEWDDDVGHAMICSLSPTGTLTAGADPRSDGATLVTAR